MLRASGVPEGKIVQVKGGEFMQFDGYTMRSSPASTNFVERAIAGIKPLNYPKVILPTHWDNFEKPYSEGPQELRGIFGDPANLDLWMKEAKQVSPKSKIVVMKFFEAYAA